MLLIANYLAPSPIQGLGCFSSEYADKGSVVWRFDPIIDRRFTLQDIAYLPLEAQRFLHMYAYIDPNYGPTLEGDNTRFFNHSEDPSTIPLDFEMLAARDIKPGDELTCDYRACGLSGLCRDFLREAKADEQHR